MGWAPSSTRGTSASSQAAAATDARNGLHSETSLAGSFNQPLRTAPIGFLRTSIRRTARAAHPYVGSRKDPAPWVVLAGNRPTPEGVTLPGTASAPCRAFSRAAQPDAPGP